MIIGITGTYGSGKDTAAKLLQEQGFIHISLSDMLRDIARERGIEITRQNLINIGNEMRETHGNGYLATKASEQIDENKNYIISSIRNPGEVQTLRSLKQFKLILVTAPEEIRLQRLIKYSRPENPKTLEDMRAKELQENSSDPTKQQLNTVASMADMTIQNIGTLEDLKHKLNEIITNVL